MKINSFLFFLTGISVICLSSCKTKKTATEVKAPEIKTVVSIKKDSMRTPTYAEEIKNILDKNCLPCHATQQGVGPMINNDFQEFALDSYEKVKAIANHKKFLGVINHEEGFPPMPIGADKLNDETIRKITAWVQGGMP